MKTDELAATRGTHYDAVVYTIYQYSFSFDWRIWGAAFFLLEFNVLEFNVRRNERTRGYRRYFCHARVRVQDVSFLRGTKLQPLTSRDINLCSEKVAEKCHLFFHSINFYYKILVANSCGNAFRLEHVISS